MDFSIDCLPCVISHAVEIIKMADGDAAARLAFARRVLRAIADSELADSPPALAKKIHAIAREITGVDDPYREIKDASTQFVLSLLPELRKEIAARPDAFESTVRAVIAGNIIDFGACPDFNLNDAKAALGDAFDADIDRAALTMARRALDEAKNVLYILDNCGEAVFDRFLIERYRDKLTLVVRGGPIINDITRRELGPSGLDGLCPVIDTGDRAPGVWLPDCSQEFRDAFAAADLIVAKGQGNFETLCGVNRPIVFLFKVKCRVIAHMVGREVGSLMVVARNLSQ